MSQHRPAGNPKTMQRGDMNQWRPQQCPSPGARVPLMYHDDDKEQVVGGDGTTTISHMTRPGEMIHVFSSHRR